ncbi:hypothetical protein GCM10022276_20630 [Sphingomonas limnosediminicola]|uniref:Uncharacterized protein n=1 Tax=Sphingomonas limnosediminicola TaxID=940133 RepID=A0ABP7LH33_9SPHN
MNGLIDGSSAGAKLAAAPMMAREPAAELASLGAGAGLRVSPLGPPGEPGAASAAVAGSININAPTKAEERRWRRTTDGHGPGIGVSCSIERGRTL